jgi:Chloride channel protein EriC
MAVTAPVIGAPLTAIIVVLELTRNYEFAIASMIAVVFSTALCYRMTSRSFFDLTLLKNGYDLSQGRDQARMALIPVSRYMMDEAPVFCASEHLSVAREVVNTHGWAEVFLMDHEGRYIGNIRSADILTSHAPTLNDLPYREGLTFSDTTSIKDAMTMLEGFVGDAVPVVSQQTHKLIGAVTEADVIQAYLHVVDDLRKEEHATLL